MEITTINKTNLQAFSHLIGDKIAPGQAALGVIEDGAAAGAALFSLLGQACTMDFICVDETMRRRKVGTTLVKKAEEAFLPSGRDRMLAFYEENAETTAFLESLGFTCVPALPIFSLSCKELPAMEKCEALVKKFGDQQVKTFDQLTRREKTEIAQGLDKAMFDPALLTPGAFDEQLSFVYEKDGVPAGVLLAREEAEEIHVAALASFGEDQTTVLRLFAAMLKAMRRKEYRKICFVGRNESVTSFMENVFEGKDVLNKEGMTWEAMHYSGGEDHAEAI